MSKNTKLDKTIIFSFFNKPNSATKQSNVCADDNSNSTKLSSRSISSSSSSSSSSSISSFSSSSSSSSSPNGTCSNISSISCSSKSNKETLVCIMTKNNLESLSTSWDVSGVRSNFIISINCQ